MTTTQYVWDVENDSFLAEADATGTLRVQFTNEPVVYGDIISKISGGENDTGYFHSDGQSNVCQLTNTSQEITFSASYGAFGDVFRSTEGSTESLLYKGAFGSVFDGEVNTYYVRARSYSPLTARWLAMDRLGFQARDVNVYRFVFNSPTRYNDPSGLKVLIYIWEGAAGKDILIGGLSIPGLSYSVMGDVYQRIAKEVFGDDADISYEAQKVLVPAASLIQSKQINTRARTRVSSDCKYCYDRIVLAGYSWGAHYAVNIAAGMEYHDPRVTVDLVFTIDPVFSEGRYTIAETEHIDTITVYDIPFKIRTIKPSNFCKWLSFHQESDTSSLFGFHPIRGDILDWSEDQRITRLQLNSDQYTSLPGALKTIPVPKRDAYGHVFIPYLSAVQAQWRKELTKIKQAGPLKSSFDDKTCRGC